MNSTPPPSNRTATDALGVSGMANCAVVSVAVPRPIRREFRPFSSILMVFAVLLLTNHLGRPFEHIFVGLGIPAV